MVWILSLKQKVFGLFVFFSETGTLKCHVQGSILGSFFSLLCVNDLA